MAVKDVIVDISDPPLHAFQLQCELASKRFDVLVCHRRWGKTEYAVKRVVNAALRNTRTYPVPQYAFLSPQLNQAKRNAWPKFEKLVTPLLPYGAKIDRQNNQFRLPNGAIIHFLGTDANVDSIRGIYLDGAVCDEIGDYKPEVFEEVIRPTLSDYEGWCMFIGTPKGPNQFRDFANRGLSGEARWADWGTHIYTIDDTQGNFPWMKLSEIEAMANEMGGRSSDKWKREMLCRFDVSSEEAYIPMPLAMSCARPHPEPEMMKGIPAIMGVDIGRSDGDPTIICVRRGSLVEPLVALPGLDNMATAEAIAREIRRWNPRYAFLDMGGGQGVVDRLHQLGFRRQVVGIAFGSKTGVEAQFLNKRAEMYGTVRKELREGRLWLPSDNQLLEDLAAPTHWRTSGDKIQLESKEDIRSRLGRSPDRGDALALTFAWPHAANAGVTGHRNDGLKAEGDYDPYADIR